MITVEQACMEIVAKLRADSKSRTVSLYKQYGNINPDHGVAISDEHPIELSGAIACKESKSQHPIIKDIEHALNSALQMGITHRNATSLGYYQFKIDERGGEGGARLILAFEQPVTPHRFDRDMERLQSILEGSKQSMPSRT